MEYGGITPVGLPAGWRLLIDDAAAAADWVLVGSGRRRGKLILPGSALAQLPGAEILPVTGRAGRRLSPRQGGGNGPRPQATG